MYNNSKNNKNSDSIYLIDNPYGFQININHPKINVLYRRYKEWKGLSRNEPISNKQRFEFETYIIELLKKKKV